MSGGFDQLRPPAMHWSSDPFRQAMLISDEPSYSDTANSCDQHAFWAHVVRRVRGLCCGTCSEFMLKDVFKAHVVGHVVGSCLGLCAGPMF